MTPVTAAKVKYGVWGLIVGAVIVMIIGFAWGGVGKPGALPKRKPGDCLRESNQRLTLLTVCSTPSNSANRLSPCRFAVIGHP
jgi:hypothetical protein